MKFEDPLDYWEVKKNEYRLLSNLPPIMMKVQRKFDRPQAHQFDDKNTNQIYLKDLRPQNLRETTSNEQ
uniref:Uncharacterized protein n=1 Tax=Romanomermis culicivorax TaxID=13658 RepID=A0A915KJH5_ROMCU